jgi:hypothetical protein
LVGALTDFAAIAAHTNEQCENRCGFVATHFAAAISSLREIKIFSILARNSHELFKPVGK